MRWISNRQQERDHRGLRNACAMCGKDGHGGDPLVISVDGFRVHRSHVPHAHQ